MKQVAIDFGSTFTYIYVIDEDKKVKRFPQLSAQSKSHYYRSATTSRTTLGIPTCRHYDENRSIKLYGYWNSDERQSIPLGGLKQNIRNDLFDENRQKDIEKFFEQIFQSANFNCAEVDRVMFGHPAYGKKESKNEIEAPSFVSDYKTIITNILKKIFKNATIEGREEPRAAAYAAYKAGILQENKNTMIVDIGGGTLDFTIARCVGKDADTGEAWYGGEYGGDYFDKIVIAGVDDSLTLDKGIRNIKWGYADEVDKAITKRSLLAAKEALFVDNKNEYEIAISESKNTIKLICRNVPQDYDIENKTLNLYSYVDHYVEKIYEEITQKLKKADVHISKILFVGNGSSMPKMINDIRVQLSDSEFDFAREDISQVSGDGCIEGFEEPPNTANLIAMGLALALRDGENSIPKTTPKFRMSICCAKPDKEEVWKWDKRDTKRQGYRNGVDDYKHISQELAFKDMGNGKQYAVLGCEICEEEGATCRVIQLWQGTEDEKDKLPSAVNYEYREKRALYFTLRENSLVAPCRGSLCKRYEDWLIEDNRFKGKSARLYFVVIQQDGPFPKEIFVCPVVRNGSTDRTIEISLGNKEGEILCVCVDDIAVSYPTSKMLKTSTKTINIIDELNFQKENK